MDIDEAHEMALDALHYYVWCGEYGEEDVAIIIGEEVLCLDDGEFEDEAEAEELEEWIEGIVAKEFAKKRKAEATWPEVTDCARLDNAFDELGEHDILAEHQAGYTQSDGLEIVEELRQDEPLGKAGKRPSRGYCFYHQQDVEGAMDGTVGLHLNFGSFDGAEADGVAVGERIRDTLETHGFQVQWDGSIRTRLLITPFVWRKRSP